MNPTVRPLPPSPPAPPAPPQAPQPDPGGEHGVAFDLLFTEICDQLRRKASALCRRERSPMFSTGDLLNDVYVKLRKHPTYSLAVAERSRTEFLWIATAAMRHVLIDAARRPGPSLIDCLTLSSADGAAEPMTLSPEQLLDLDAALTALERKHPRPAAMIVMRFYGGLSIQELHEHWDVANATVGRDLRLALKFMNALLARKARERA